MKIKQIVLISLFCFIQSTFVFQETILIVNDKISIGLKTDKSRMVWGSEMNHLFLNLQDPFVVTNLINTKFQNYMKDVTFNDKITVDEYMNVKVNKTIDQKIVRHSKYFNLTSNQINFTKIISPDYKFEVEHLDEYLNYHKQHFLTDSLTVILPLEIWRIQKIIKNKQQIDLVPLDDKNGFIAKINENFLVLINYPINSTLQNIQDQIFQTYYKDNLFEQVQKWSEIRNTTVNKINQNILGRSNSKSIVCKKIIHKIKKELRLTLTKLGMFELNQEVYMFDSTANFILDKADLWWSSGKLKEALDLINEIIQRSQNLGEKIQFLGEQKETYVTSQYPVTIFVGIICLFSAFYQLYNQKNLWSFYKKIV